MIDGNHTKGSKPITNTTATFTPSTTPSAPTTERPTLVNIVDQITDIVSQSEDGLTSDQEQALDALGLQLEDKVAAYALVNAHLKNDAEACKGLSSYYGAKAKSADNRARALRERLQGEMQRLGVSNIKTATATAYVQQNPPSVQCDDALVPDEYTVITRVVDRKRILGALKAGLDLGFATLSYGYHLRFK